jgi:hypothetical protein
VQILASEKGLHSVVLVSEDDDINDCSPLTFLDSGTARHWQGIL